MKISQTYGGDYLKATELEGRRLQVTIERVVEAQFEQNGAVENKAVLYCERASKGIVLNRTNAQTLAQAWGDETDAWLGLTLEVWAEPTTFRGRSVPGIKVKPITQLGDT